MLKVRCTTFNNAATIFFLVQDFTFESSKRFYLLFFLLKILFLKFSEVKNIFNYICFLKILCLKFSEVKKKIQL